MNIVCFTLMDKTYAQKLKQKMAVFQKITRTSKQLFWVMIAANGLKPTLYSEELVSQVITLQDLFAPLA
jgi:hypothetical protein